MNYGKINVRGVEIFYREDGDKTKPNFVLFHGFPSASHIFGIKAEAVSTQEEFAYALADTEHPRVIVLNVWRSFVEPMIKGNARIDE